jgi:hypothetical protein
VNPGEISDHVHVIAGGNAFGPTMTYEDARSSSCTTCNIKQDLSNYWTPKLYYQAQNGSLASVPIDGDDSQGNQGGMAIYYLYVLQSSFWFTVLIFGISPRRGPNNDQLVPFPKGFRMFAGDPMKRLETKDFAGQAVRHRCVGSDGEFTNLPNKKCPQGVRTQVVFPSCWDGKNLDSEDHKTHVSYPKDGNYDGGRCPDTHPKHFLTLFYEVTYRTDMFEWYSDKQPFVLSNGDPTGYGYHGDFVRLFFIVITKRLLMRNRSTDGMWISSQKQSTNALMAAEPVIQVEMSSTSILQATVKLANFLSEL